MASFRCKRHSPPETDDAYRPAIQRRRLTIGSAERAKRAKRAALQTCSSNCVAYSDSKHDESTDQAIPKIVNELPLTPKTLFAGSKTPAAALQGLISKQLQVGQSVVHGENTPDPESRQTGDAQLAHPNTRPSSYTTPEPTRYKPEHVYDLYDPDFGSRVRSRYRVSQHRHACRISRYGTEVANTWKRGSTPETARDRWKAHLDARPEEVVMFSDISEHGSESDSSEDFDTQVERVKATLQGFSDFEKSRIFFLGGQIFMTHPDGRNEKVGKISGGIVSRC